VQVEGIDVELLASALASRLTQKLRVQEHYLLDRMMLAGRLAISERGVTALAGRGELPPGYLIGGVRRWDWGEVLRYLAARATRKRRRGRGMYDRNRCNE
jgi:hypothetical protein